MFSGTNSSSCHVNISLGLFLEYFFFCHVLLDRIVFSSTEAKFYSVFTKKISFLVLNAVVYCFLTNKSLHCFENVR